MDSIQRDRPPHESFTNASPTSPSPTEEVRAELATVKAEWAKQVERTTMEKEGLHHIIERLKSENVKLQEQGRNAVPRNGDADAETSMVETGEKKQSEQLRERLVAMERHYRTEVQQLRNIIASLQSTTAVKPTTPTIGDPSSQADGTAIAARDAARRESSRLRQALERLEREKEEMQLFVGIAEQQVATWKAEREITEEQERIGKHERERGEKEVEGMRQAREAALKEVERLKADVKRLQASHAESQRLVTEAESRVSEERKKAKRDITTLQTTHSTTERETGRLRADNERLASSNAELQRRFDAAKAQVSTLKEASEKGLREFDKAMVEVKGGAKREAGRLEGDVERLGSLNLELQRKLDDATRQRTTLKAQLDTSEASRAREVQSLQSVKSALVGDLDKSKTTNRDLREALQKTKTREEKRLVEFQTADALSQWMAKELRRKCEALEEAEKQLTMVRREAEGLRSKQAEGPKEDPEKMALRRDLQLLKTHTADAQKTMERKLQAAMKEVETLKSGNAMARQHIKKLKEQFDACQADRMRKKAQILALQGRVEALEAGSKVGEVLVKEEVAVDGMIPLSARSEAYPPTPTAKGHPMPPSTNVGYISVESIGKDKAGEQTTIYRAPVSSSNALTVSLSSTEKANLRGQSLMYRSPISLSNAMTARVLDLEKAVPQDRSTIHRAPIWSSNAVPVGSVGLSRESRVDVVPATQSRKPLTAEIHCCVAGFLAGDNAYGSLANYNLVSRALHLTTLPVLYETVVWDDNGTDYGTYGITDPCAPNRTLPVGWSFTRHVFYSGHHRDHLHDYITRCPTWKAQSRNANMQPLSVAFPQIRVALAWHMEKVEPSEVAFRGLELRRHSRLQLRGAMACDTFHRLFTSLRVRYWPGGHDGPMQLGPIYGITDIRILSPARLTGTCALNPVHRFFNYTDRRLFVTSQLPESDEGWRTMQEVLRLVERPNPEDQTWRDDRPVELQLWGIRPLAFRVVLETLWKVLPTAPQDLRLNVQLTKPRHNLTVEMIRKEFRYVVEMFICIWHEIPLPRRNGTHASKDCPPFFRFLASSVDKINFEGTIVPTIGAFGKTFIADLKAYKDGAAIFLAGSQYPDAFPKGLY